MTSAPDLLREAEAILRASFTAAVHSAPAEPALFVELGAIGVRVQAEEVGPGEAVLECYAWIAQGLRVTPEVAMALVERSATLRFGALAVDGEGAVILSHALFAESVSAPVLVRLVHVLAETAEALDREFLQHWR